ncbi:outer membrane beta-barrel family protein [Pedobacter sp. BS3]|uniref:outer membrane beta-barrel family protein n=1 Tax=Pedobacter sp. BS3 TaxID=2567937 RepID=UPI001659468D|nr:outer membrane beta-barrel family protein [Pedobacter sp. BS3]
MSLLAGFFFITGNVRGQGNGKITGKVIDHATGKAVDFASVALINKATSKTAKTTQTDLQGGFKFENLPTGNYLLKISFVGYQSYTKDNITITSSAALLNLGIIKLSTGKANMLKEVVVQAQKSTIQLGIDRKVFNVEQSLVSEGGSASDLLANVPSVSVDMDGNVNLRGSSNVKILIDGKPSAMGGNNIADVLQSLPASAIETIELITNPSSKYQADGQSGIINIVLKKNKKLGINGSVSLGAGTQDNYNANANLSYRNGKFNLYGNYSYRDGNRPGSGYNRSTYVQQNGFINNSSESSRKDKNNGLKLGADYYLGKQTVLGASGNFNFRDFKRGENLDYIYQNIAEPYNTSQRLTRRNGGENSYDLSLDLSRKFKHKGEELTANFSYGKSDEDYNQQFSQQFNMTDGSVKDSLNRSANNERGENYNIQVDYVLPVNDKVRWETGYRSTIRNDWEDQFFENYQSGNYITDLNQTNKFSMEDIVHAAYINYQNKFGKNFGMQVGIRAEQAYLNTVYRGTDTATLQPSISKSNLDYFRIYPSIFFTQKFKGEQQLQLSYTRRVDRPHGWEVNPFLDISDPSNYRQGNPNLKPEDIHSFELSYSKFWKTVTLTSAVYYRRVNDVVQSIRDIYPGSNAITLTRFYNLTSSNAVGFEVISRADVSKALSLTGNLNMFYNQLNGNEAFHIRSSDGYNWMANLTANLKLPQNVSAQFNLSYMAPRNTAQGHMHEIFSSDAGLRYDFLKQKRGSLSFNVRDVFNTRRYAWFTETESLLQDSERRRQKRMAGITFSYRFGKQDKQDLQKRRKNNMDDDTRQRSDEEF